MFVARQNEFALLDMSLYSSEIPNSVNELDEKILETVEPIYLKQYFTIIKERNVKEKIIIASGSKKVQQKNIEYKELDKKYLGDTTTVVYQNKVYLFIWGNPHYLIVINSAKVSNNYLKQFNLFWEVAK